MSQIDIGKNALSYVKAGVGFYFNTPRVTSTGLRYKSFASLASYYLDGKRNKALLSSCSGKLPEVPQFITVSNEMRQVLKEAIAMEIATTPLLHSALKGIAPNDVIWNSEKILNGLEHAWLELVREYVHSI